VVGVKVGGIDVGLKRSVSALISGRSVRVFHNPYRLIEEGVEAVGIDSPLSFPESGPFRECERKLIEMGIRLFPSGAGFFRKVALKGMELAKAFESAGVEVYEVYPYATRVILNIAPHANKRRREGLEEIKRELERYVDAMLLRDHDEVDAAISALTVLLYRSGHGTVVDGTDGAIVVPKNVD